MPILQTLVVPDLRNITPGGRTYCVHDKLINDLSIPATTQGAWSNSIAPYGANRILFALHSDANAALGISALKLRYHTRGRGQADAGNWFSEASLPDHLLALSTVPVNWAVNKGTDPVGGPVITELGFVYPATHGAFMGFMPIEELQIAINNTSAAARIFRVDAIIEWSP